MGWIHFYTGNNTTINPTKLLLTKFLANALVTRREMKTLCVFPSASWFRSNPASGEVGRV